MPLGFKSSEIFGVKVTPTTMDDLFTLMDRSVAAKDQVVAHRQILRVRRPREDINLSA